MRTGKGGVVGYNVQTAVDVKHTLIAEQQVYNNLNDFGLLATCAERSILSACRPWLPPPRPDGCGSQS